MLCLIQNVVYAKCARYRDLCAIFIILIIQLLTLKSVVLLSAIQGVGNMKTYSAADAFLAVGNVFPFAVLVFGAKDSVLGTGFDADPAVAAFRAGPNRRVPEQFDILHYVTILDLRKLK